MIIWVCHLRIGRASLATMHRPHFQRTYVLFHPCAKCNMNRRKCDLRLSELLKITNAFISFSKSLNRRLTDEERRVNRWIAEAWEWKGIREECSLLPDCDQDEIHDLLSALRELFAPYPVRRSKVVSEVNGNTAHPVVVKDWTMTDREARDRLKLLRYLVTSTTHVIKELSLHEGSNRGLVLKYLRRFEYIARYLSSEIGKSVERTKADAI